MLRRSFLLGGAALPLCMAARPAETKAASFDLFGPESRYDHALEYNAMTWGWPGSALTASTQMLAFNKGYPWSIAWARFSVVWWPLDTAWINLIYFDAGPANIVGVSQLTSPNRLPSNPVPIAADVTGEFRSLAAAGIPKFIGYQLHGHVKVGVVRLEMVFD